MLLLVFLLWPPVRAIGDLSQQLDRIVNRPSQQKVRFSVKVVDPGSGKTVFEHNAHTPMIPASNMKLITTAAALKYLGPSYQYRTRIGLCGDTLAVIGSGDPLLGDERTDARYGRKDDWLFERIAEILKRAGVTDINDIIVDSSVFDDQRVHPEWPADQLNRPYACEVSGLNFNGNCISITAHNLNGTIDILTNPKTTYLQITNKVKALNKGRSAIGAYRTARPNKIIVKGKCRKQAGPFAVAIERPAGFFGFLLAEKLSGYGINVHGRLVEKRLDKSRVFAELFQTATPIADCLARCNKDSFGLAAEALVKTIAATAEPGGNNGNWATGTRLVSEYLLALGVAQNEFRIDDGSGLSKKNKLSANVLTTVLLDVYSSQNQPVYRNSLAIGGVDGTIAKYFREKAYKGKILGKTGYIKTVKSFSGICSGKGRDYLFAIVANNANGKTRTAINDMAKAILDN